MAVDPLWPVADTTKHTMDLLCKVDKAEVQYSNHSLK
jgi:hypothetical protein